MIKHIASVSFGKDSLAMLLRLIAENRPLDEVVFYDTGMEFQAIYRIRDKIKPLLHEKGIAFTELKPTQPFLYDMLERPIRKKDGSIQTGYGWCGGGCRWGTGKKQNVIDAHGREVIVYIGIAADELRRLNKPHNGDKRYPLAEWGMAEADCLAYCRAAGYGWMEDGIDLYDILDRVSCWCCRNKNLRELRNYYLHLPKYWRGLKDLQDKMRLPYKKGATIYDLEERFGKEE